MRSGHSLYVGRYGIWSHGDLLADFPYLGLPLNNAKFTVIGLAPTQ